MPMGWSQHDSPNHATPFSKSGSVILRTAQRHGARLTLAKKRAPILYTLILAILTGIFVCSRVHALHCESSAGTSAWMIVYCNGWLHLAYARIDRAAGAAVWFSYEETSIESLKKMLDGLPHPPITSPSRSRLRTLEYTDGSGRDGVVAIQGIDPHPPLFTKTLGFKHHSGLSADPGLPNCWDTNLIAPSWPIFAAPIIGLVISIMRNLKTKTRLLRGLCINCSYDLRSHAPGDKCPECGTPIRSAGKSAAAPGSAKAIPPPSS